MMESKSAKILLAWFLVSWGIFCAVFFTLPDFSSVSAAGEGQEIAKRILYALGFGALFSSLFTYITIYSKKIEWTFVIVGWITYAGACALIAWLFASEDYSLLTLNDLSYSLLLAFPAALILIEGLEAIL